MAAARVAAMATVWLVLACSPQPQPRSVEPPAAAPGDPVPPCPGAGGDLLRGMTDDRAWEVSFSPPNSLVSIRVENHTMAGVHVVPEAGRLKASFRGYEDLMIVTAQLPLGMRMRMTTAGGDVIDPCRFAVGPRQASLVVAIFPHEAPVEALVVDEANEVAWAVDKPTLRQWADSRSFALEFDVVP